jgi:uncharacterized protein
MKYGLFKTHLVRVLSRRYKKGEGCEPGTKVLSMDPDGDFFTCHRFMSEENYKIGMINDGITKKIEFDSKKSMANCDKCWNQFTCTHGCYYNNFVLTGDQYKKTNWCCQYSKKMTEICLSMIPEFSDEELISLLTII